MREIHVECAASRLNFPLPPMHAGALSSAVALIYGVPADIKACSLVIQAPGQNPDPARFRADAVKEGTAWRCYLNPYCFPAAATGLEYHVVGIDTHDNPRWLGRGTLDVYDNPAQGSGDVPAVVPRDTYIRNPVTGLYHLLTATVDGDGNITLDLAEEGVER